MLDDLDVFDSLTAKLTIPTNILASGASIAFISNNIPTQAMQYVNGYEWINVTRNAYTLHYVPVANKIYNDIVNLTLSDEYKNNSAVVQI